jgi:tetratricopeptide (TPR) repeat protein
MTDRITQLQKLLAVEPNDTFCMYGLAIEHAKRGEHALALEWFDRTIENDTDYCYAYFHKAKCQEDAGDSHGARRTVDAGIQRAAAAKDAKALSELSSYLDELS